MATSTEPRWDDKYWYGLEPEGASYRARETILWASLAGHPSQEIHAGEEIPPRELASIGPGSRLHMIDGFLHYKQGSGLNRIGHLNAIPDRETLVERGLAERI